MIQQQVTTNTLEHFKLLLLDVIQYFQEAKKRTLWQICTEELILLKFNQYLSLAVKFTKVVFH